VLLSRQLLEACSAGGGRATPRLRRQARCFYADLARQRVQAYERGEGACDGDADYHEGAASCIWR
jgi:hypothetical protein